jgi:hypothetical protein
MPLLPYRFAALALVSFCSSVAAQTLYAVSVRTYSDPSYKGVEGNLYQVDPESAVTTLVAPLRLDGRESIGLDGLAIQRETGEFFGVTAPTTRLVPHSLVRLDPETGTVTLVADLGVDASDVSFDSEGTLFIWLPKTRQVGRVDLKTAAIVALGTPSDAEAPQGGIEVVSRDLALVAASTANGTLDSIDLKTGALVGSVQLKGAHYPELIAGLAEAPDGTLFGVNSNGGVPSLADLVKIDRRTGQIIVVGPLPNDTDAIAFGPAAKPENTWDLDRWRAVLYPVLIVVGFALAILLGYGTLRGR